MTRGSFLFGFAAFVVLTCTVPQALLAGVYQENMNSAREFRLQGKFLDAEKSYDKMLKKNPANVDALVGRGFSRLAQGSKADEAISDFSRAIELAPDYVDAYTGKAAALKRKGNFDRAEKTLRKCKQAVNNDKEKLRYLATSAWKLGFFTLARELDRENPPKSSRQLIEFPNEITFTISKDWVKNRHNWRKEKLTFVRRQRPDFAWWISGSHYRRYKQDDEELGTGFSYNWSRGSSISYNGYFSLTNDFLAEQKHQPKITFNPLAFTYVSLGTDLFAYDSDWATLGRVEVQRYLKSWYGKYTLLFGNDSNNQYVDTSIYEIGYTRENNYFFRLGYSSGGESIEQGGGNDFSKDRIESIYGMLRYFIDRRWGIITSLSREWRENEFFRTTGSISVFKRF